MKEISPDVFLCTSEELISDQKFWPETDECKTMDFTQFKYWVTTDDGIIPFGFDTEAEAITAIGSLI